MNPYIFKNLPCLTIDQVKFKYNVQFLNEYLMDKGIYAHFSIKGLGGFEPLIRLMHEVGINRFADSDLNNLSKARAYAESTMLNRIPMISEVSRIINEVDISLNSEIETIFALSDAAVAANKKHGVILSVEMGDLAEGILPDSLIDTVHQILNLRGIDLKGIRFNVNTFSGVKTSLDKVQYLADLAGQIEERFEISLDYVSAGNSGGIELLNHEEYPESINHMVVGQAYLFGFETSNHHRISNMHQDIFSLYAEVVENKRKDSMPSGELGYNYNFERKDFVDLGTIRRAIVALGSQDVDQNSIVPKEKGLEFIGSSLDYSIFNISHYNHDLNIGSLIEFIPNYLALNRLFHSRRVAKVIV